ncbi:MAG: SDR family NAD(P)-dependent oxidoreductase, partial [Pseudomonadales bacterium]
MDIAGKNILITGAASGIGKAMAQRFHAEGAAKLFLADLNEAALMEVAQPLGADFCPCNVGLEHDVLGMIKRAEAALGHIDLLCNNAGIS